MPFKANAARRHHIPKQRHKVTNWAAYDAALRQRGSLTGWFTDEAIATWAAEPRTTPGGQPSYSALAILTALTLRAVFRLAPVQSLVGQQPRAIVLYNAADRAEPRSVRLAHLADARLDAVPLAEPAVVGAGVGRVRVQPADDGADNLGQAQKMREEPRVMPDLNSYLASF